MRYIRLMADYQCHPVWDISPGEYGDIDPSALPISKELKSRLAKWACLYDETLDLDCPQCSGFKSEELEAEFNREGRLLADCLQNELGADFVVTAKI